MVRDEDLDFWIKNNYNVMFIGQAGVGKTTIVKQAFDRHKLRWKYFSAATMDPWVDFVGVPKEHKDEDGTVYLDLIRPKEFQRDEIDALFVDEFSRGSKKTRNACLELIQFKSINGKKFNNLKIVWTAINPADDENYDVEKLDPAQEDRFHIKVYVPYRPDRTYFVKNYGEEMAKAAISWWDGLSKEHKDMVSPRRLDYALDVFTKHGDMRYVLPEVSNVSKLITTIKHGPISEVMDRLKFNKDVDAARVFLAQENNYAAAVEWLMKSKERLLFFLPTLPLEKVAAILAAPGNFVYDAAVQLAFNNNNIRDLLKNIVVSNSNRSISNRLRKDAKRNKGLNDLLEIHKPKAPKMTQEQVEKPWFNVNPVGNHAQNVQAALTIMQSKSYMSTLDRRKLYNTVEKSIPLKLATPDAVETLKFLSGFAVRSQAKTLKGVPSFMGMINHCVSQIAVNERINWDQIKKHYKVELQQIIRKIKKEPDLEQKLYCPTSKSQLNNDGKVL